MTKRPHYRWAMLALVATAACETTTEPTPNLTFDAEAAIEDYRALDDVLSSRGWAGFQALGSRDPFNDVGSTPTVGMEMIRSFETLAKSGDTRTFAAALIDGAKWARTQTVRTSAPIISALHRGETFVYDDEVGDYRVDPTRTDAPSNGVRFEMYEEDSEGKPNTGAVIGYADLIDEGDGSAEDVVLRLLVVVDGSTVLDYRTSLDENDDNNGGTITVDGFLQGDNDRLEFAIDVTGSDNGNDSMVDITFDVAMPSRDFTITGTLMGSEGESGAGDIDIEVRHGAESLRVDVEGTDTEINGTFFLNGDVFATASGHPDSPTFVSATGEPLTAGEVGVLLRIVAVVADVFQLFEDLVEPVGHLVLLGLIL